MDAFPDAFASADFGLMLQFTPEAFPSSPLAFW
jgi:hypothetical protein